MIGVGVAGWSLYGRLYGRFVPGWATIMITVSLGASAQLIMTGILGEYVGRIYEEVKRRPLYVVADEVNATREAMLPKTTTGPNAPAALEPPDESQFEGIGRRRR